jgi:hypothetical protein
VRQTGRPWLVHTDVHVRKQGARHAKGGIVSTTNDLQELELACFQRLVELHEQAFFWLGKTHGGSKNKLTTHVRWKTIHRRYVSDIPYAFADGNRRVPEERKREPIPNEALSRKQWVEMHASGAHRASAEEGPSSGDLYPE